MRFSSRNASSGATVNLLSNKWRRSFFAVAFFLFTLCGAWGANYYKWITSGSGSWNDTSNWQSSATGAWLTWSAAGESPTDSSTVYINTDDASSSNIVITLDSDVTVGTLYFESSSSTNVTLNLNGHTLTVGSLVLGNQSSSSDTTTVEITGNGTVSATSIKYNNSSTTSSLNITNGATVSSSGDFTSSTAISVEGDGTGALTVAGSTDGSVTVSGDVATTTTDYTWTGGGDGTTWTDAANWGGSGYPGVIDTATFTGDAAVTVKFTSNTTTGVINFNTAGDSLITLNTNGYTITTGDILLNDATSVGSSAANIEVTGGGKISVASGYRFDFPDNTTSNLTIDSGTEFEILGTYYGNGGSGSMNFAGSGTLSIPASGANLDYGSSIVTYAASLTIIPNGTPTHYYLSAINPSTLPISVTANCLRDGGTQTITFPYEVSITNTSDAVYTFNGATLTDGDTGSISVAGADTTTTTSLALTSGTITTGEGVTIIIYTPDNALELGRITYLEDVSSWTGASDTAWENTGNWSLGTLPATTADVVINAGVTNFPVISTAVTVNSLTITSNANVSMTGGSLTLTSLECTGNSKFTATGGTVIFNNASSSWEATYPTYSAFYNVTIPSGDNESR